jgi:hypothetical protein
MAILHKENTHQKVNKLEEMGILKAVTSLDIPSSSSSSL